jgi:glutaredoxin-like protein NrdH
MSVTVYTTPNCVQCNATKKHLDRRGIPYEVIDLSENQDKLAEFVSMGMSTAPIVDTGSRMWSGYRPADIDAIEKND